MKALSFGKTAKTAAMSSGGPPQLIAAVLMVLPNAKAFIHTPPKSLFTKTRGTLWEPDPTVSKKLTTRTVLDY